MLGLDQLIGGLAHGHSAGVALAVALLLGLRHATDPDHLVAVSTLVASESRQPARKAGLLGLAWGCGHAVTLAALGVPVVLFGGFLPPAVQHGAELVVGLVIVALAIRLLVRWWRGSFHVHLHAHDGAVHRHLHGHAAREDHGHEHVTVRSPVQAFGIGLVHGVGGSAAVGLLLLASIGDGAIAIGALALFAVATALSMAVVSSGVGYALGSSPVRARFERLAPGLALLALAFGTWYAAAAIGA
jgi:ABC-type nickel/cobalt efflux system permease component RcnA